ncbi:MAG: MotA/TolQ/ExbB proton channel family protein [Cyanobacteria bacterium MAG IRC1_bin_28]|nr:MotA/TolQ/ExbB proton channel family protein [Cyanobacteria bacterium MAG IRC1_bin_28]
MSQLNQLRDATFFPEDLPHVIDQVMPSSLAPVRLAGAPIPSNTLAVFQPVGQLIDAGGPVIVVLLGMSVLALTVAMAKLWQFASLELNRLQTVGHMLALHLEGESTQALAVARRCRNPAAAVLAQAIRGQQRRLPTAMVREEVERAGTALVVSLRANLRLLEVTASLAPLLGLLGTVLGMIEAFQQIAQAENAINPSTLSGGIWEALLTTAAGLSVAIPVVAVHNWLESRIERFTHGLNDLTTRVFTTDLCQDLPEVAP